MSRYIISNIILYFSSYHPWLAELPSPTHLVSAPHTYYIIHHSITSEHVLINIKHKRISHTTHSYRRHFN